MLSQPNDLDSKSTNKAKINKPELTEKVTITKKPGAAVPGNSKQTKVNDRQNSHAEPLSPISKTGSAPQAQSTNHVSITNNNIKEKWTTVVKKTSRRKSKVEIVGECDEISQIKTAPKKAYLFISRLHPTITSKQLGNYLRPKFPEADTEDGNLSQHPENYSFKVTIDLTNLEKALEPS